MKNLYPFGFMIAFLALVLSIFKFHQEAHTFLLFSIFSQLAILNISIGKQ